MRPSLTTLAGMTLAAGTLALTAAGATSAAEPVVLPAAQPIVEVVDAESRFVDTVLDYAADFGIGTSDANEELPDWILDGCPPCGMG